MRKICVFKFEKDTKSVLEKNDSVIKTRLSSKLTLSGNKAVFIALTMIIMTRSNKKVMLSVILSQNMHQRWFCLSNDLRVH